MRSLNFRARLFVHYYTGEAKGDAARAARMAGLKGSSGQRLLRDPRVAWAVKKVADNAAMGSQEVLARLSDMAACDLTDFLTFYDELNKAGEPTGRRKAQFDVEKLKAAGYGHLIKKFEISTDGVVKVEFYDAQAALNQLGKFHGLTSDRLEIKAVHAHVAAPEQFNAILGRLAELAAAGGIGQMGGAPEPRRLCHTGEQGEVDPGPALGSRESPIDVGGEEDN